MLDLYAIILFFMIFVLLLVSGFFSGSETGMMALNRYKLKYAVRKNDARAIRVNDLLSRPDRLLGVILLGNTFANILASALMTILAVKLFGEIGVFIATILLTIIVLVFAEVMPKTLAALYPDKVAYSVSGALSFLLRLLYPLVWLVNYVSNKFLALFNIDASAKVNRSLQREELIEIIQDGGDTLSRLDQGMLTGVLDLQRIHVEDVMVPRTQVEIIDISQHWSKVLESLKSIAVAQILVVNKYLSNPVGLLNLQDILRLSIDGHLTKKMLTSVLSEVAYIPSGITVSHQLSHFKSGKFKVGIVVDEYGDALGILSLEDILDEIIGEIFYNNGSAINSLGVKFEDGLKVSGDANIRELNREYSWGLPDDGPNTLSGLIIEYLEIIPDAQVCLQLGDVFIEVLSCKDKRIEWVKVTFK